MSPPLAWEGQCSACGQRFPLETQEEHRAVCEKRSAEDFAAKIDRPKSWAFGVGIVREVFSKSERGPNLRVFYVGVTETPLTRAQLSAYRDLITLALTESPDPVAVVPVTP